MSSLARQIPQEYAHLAHAFQLPPNQAHLVRADSCGHTSSPKPKSAPAREPIIWQLLRPPQEERPARPTETPGGNDELSLKTREKDLTWGE